MFIRQGEYKNAVFKFRIEIPEDYPTEMPTVVFENDVYHPLVDAETGELNLKPQFSSWRPRKDFIFVILAYMKKIFYNQDYYKMTCHVKNPSAFSLANTDETAFLRNVKSCCQSSNERIIDSPGVKFSKFDPRTHSDLYNLLSTRA
jgi:ubiquitin-protein ligase